MDKPDGEFSNPYQPLPQIGISEILGLVEVLKSKGGKEDIYKLAAELQMDAGEILQVIRGAELLGLVHTPGGDVVIEDLGEKVSKSRINARKQIIKDQLANIPIFKELTEYMKGQESHQATRDELLDKLTELMPNEDCQQAFTTLVNWGRYAELFGYNDDREAFYLDSGP